MTNGVDEELTQVGKGIVDEELVQAGIDCDDEFVVDVEVDGWLIVDVLDGMVLLIAEVGREEAVDEKLEFDNDEIGLVVLYNKLSVSVNVEGFEVLPEGLLIVEV
jgi:hypothetical protein